MDIAVPADYRIKLKESEKKDKYFDLARELKKKKNIEHESDDYTNHDWCFWYNHQRIIKRAKGLEGWWMSGVYPNYIIIENGQNNEKSPAELET